MKAFYYPLTRTLTSISTLGISTHEWINICNEAHKFDLLFIHFIGSWDKFKSLNHQGTHLAKILILIRKSAGYNLYSLPTYLGDYILDFFVDIISNERYANKNHSLNLITGIHNQYDSSNYYKLGYMLGNYVKHYSKIIPTRAINNETGTKIYINIHSLLNSNWKWKSKELSVLKSLNNVSVYDFVKETLIILFMQPKYLGMDLFYQQKESVLSKFYKDIYSKYIIKYGYPFLLYKDKSNPHKFKIKTHFDHLSYDFIRTVKIINKLGLDNIKIKKK